jgi:hypothetical protein
MGKHTPQAVWDQLRLAHAQGVGLRELARTSGVSEAAVLQRASREKWSEHLKAAAQVARPSGEVVNVIREVANVIEDLKAIGENTRRGFATAAQKVAQKAAGMDEDELLLCGQSVRPWQQIASSVHGWDKDNGKAGQGQVNVVVVLGDDICRPSELRSVQVVEIESDAERG